MENTENIKEIETPVVESVAPKRNRAKIGEVNCDQLNLRSEPDSDADIIYIMTSGNNVSILGEEKAFYKVMINGIIGYCMKKFITIK